MEWRPRQPFALACACDGPGTPNPEPSVASAVSAVLLAARYWAFDASRG